MGSQVFTTTGANTWNWPAGVTSATVELIGGGGAGGGATGNPANGGGGKGGGYSRKVITKGVESSLTLTVGTGGVGGTTANGASATVSTTTQNGSIVQTATAGASAAANITTTTGAGATTVIGTASGDVTFAGGSGGNGSGSTSGAGGGSAGPTSAGGDATGASAGSAGTGTFLDGTVRQVLGRAGATASAVGNIGANYGGSGSGGAAGTATDRTGGSGAPGIAVVTWTEPAPTQASFRIYADGTESGSTALAAQDTNYAADVSNGDLATLLRIRLQELTGAVGVSTDDFEIYVDVNSTGTFTPIGAADSHQDTSHASLAPSQTTNTQGWGEAFIAHGGKVSTVQFWMQRVGSPAGNLVAKIYAASGTPNAGAVPTGVALAVSDTFAATSVPTTTGWTTFTFSGANQISLTQGSNYVVTIEYPNVAPNSYGDGSNNISQGYVSSGTSTYTNGNLVQMFNGAWDGTGTADVLFILNNGGSVIPFSSANLTEGGATTNRLGAGTGSFVAGKVALDGEVNDLAITASNFSEMLFSLSLVSANLSNGDTIDFRIYKNATALNTYTVTPRITITKTIQSFTRNVFKNQSINRSSYW